MSLSPFNGLTSDQSEGGHTHSRQAVGVQHFAILAHVAPNDFRRCQRYSVHGKLVLAIRSHYVRQLARSRLTSHTTMARAAT
jgi:hypothetical protein